MPKPASSEYEMTLMLDATFLREIFDLTGYEYNEYAVVGEALGLFRVAAEEARKGRVLLSGTPQGKALTELKMPILSKVLATSGPPTEAVGMTLLETVRAEMAMGHGGRDGRAEATPAATPPLEIHDAEEEASDDPFRA